MNQPKNLFLAIGAIILLIALGFFREYVFEGINAYRYQLYYQYENPTISSGLQFFTKFGYVELYYLKFGLTAIVAMLFYGVTAYVLTILFPKAKAYRTTFIVFLLVFAASFIIYVLGLVTGKVTFFYLMARKLSEVVQSPLALMILLPIFWYQSRQKLIK